MRPSLCVVGALLAAAPAALAQTSQNNALPQLSSLSQPDGQGQSATSAPRSSAAPQTSAARQSSAQSTAAPKSDATATATPSQNGFPTVTSGGNPVRLSNAPTIAGVGVPDQKVPDTAQAAFMQKSDLPDGTVFICVAAILAFFAAAVLAWRGLVAWSLHRSVKRAAMAQNLADIKAMSAVPGKKRGMYNVVGANSTMSLDHLAAAPLGSSKSTKPFASMPGGTPPKSQSSLFFSPTAGGTPGYRDSSVNRSSTYLPAGYYASGTAAPAGGSPMAHIGGAHHGANLSVNSFNTPSNRFSAVSPPGSPSLPPSRGYDRAPPSRDGLSVYNRNSIATLGGPRAGDTRSGVYGYGHGEANVSQLSLNAPGGTSVVGGRAPSAYLEDLFENHGATGGHGGEGGRS